MMLVTWVRLGIGACIAAQRYDKFSAADVMQPQNIGQCQRLRVHVGEPVLEPHPCGDGKSLVGCHGPRQSRGGAGVHHEPLLPIWTWIRCLKMRVAPC